MTDADPAAHTEASLLDQTRERIRVLEAEVAFLRKHNFECPAEALLRELSAMLYEMRAQRGYAIAIKAALHAHYPVDEEASR